jgi:hypothetical protein
MPAAEFTLPRLKQQQDYAFLDAMVPSSNDKVCIYPLLFEGYSHPTRLLTLKLMVMLTVISTAIRAVPWWGNITKSSRELQNPSLPRSPRYVQFKI